MGAFSQLQETIDWALERFMLHQMPEVGQLIAKHYLRRIRDDERLSCLLALATDTGYSASLAEARFRFERAKQTRDLVGHSGAVAQAWNAQTKDWIVAISHRPGQKGSRVPSPLTPATFERLSNDCQWITAHVLRLTYEANLSDFIDFTGQPVEPPLPPCSPEDGEPVPYRVQQRSP